MAARSPPARPVTCSSSPTMPSRRARPPSADAVHLGHRRRRTGHPPARLRGGGPAGGSGRSPPTTPRAGDPVRHVELLLKRVRALIQAGDVIGARQARVAALRTADRVPEAARPGRPGADRARPSLAVDAAGPVRGDRDSTLVRRFEMALGTLPDGDGPGRARLLRRAGAGALQRRRAGRRAVGRGAGDGPPDRRSRSADAPAQRPLPGHAAGAAAAGAACRSPTRWRSCRRAAGAGVRAARRDDPDPEPARDLFDVAGADRAAGGCAAILRRLPLPWPGSSTPVWRANRLDLDGRFEEADRLRDAAERQAEALGMWHLPAVVAVGRLGAAVQRGRDGRGRAAAGADRGRPPDHRPTTPGCSGCAPVESPATRPAGRSRRTTGRGCRRRASRPPRRRRSARPRSAATPSAPCSRTPGGCRPRRRSSASGRSDWYLSLLASAAGDDGLADRHRRTAERLGTASGLVWWARKIPSLLTARLWHHPRHVHDVLPSRLALRQPLRGPARGWRRGNRHPTVPGR